MTISPPGLARYSQSHSARLLWDVYRLPVEQAVSAHIGRSWQVTDFRDLVEFASHPAAFLSDGAYTVFAKLSEAAHGLHQFEVELAALRDLNQISGVLIPPPIANVNGEGGVVMLLEAVETVERGPQEWRQIGQALAQIHAARGPRFGFDRQGYFGPLYQDNRPLDDWLDFFTERRLFPRLMGAIDSGHLPTQVIRQVERIIARLPRLEVPPSPPILLHGDAQKNNFISTRRGAMVIDPAPYYGHPEMDLAYVDYFEPVPAAVFEAYREVHAIEPGFEQRRDLWRIPAYLAAVQVEGPAHLFRLEGALRRYI